MERTIRWGLLAIVTLAIVARVSAVLVLQSHLVPRSTYEHGEIAGNLLAGRGFSIRFLGADGPTSQQAPVYPLLVASAFAVGGVESPRSLLLLELGQSILGGLLAAGVFELARLLVPRSPGVAFAAALVAALHPTLVYSATHVQVALLGATLLCWTLLLAYRAGEDGTRSSCVLVGACLAVLALTDPILALTGFGAGWAIVMGRLRAGRTLARAWQPVGTMCLVAAAGVAPWIVRNALVHREFVAIKSTFGYAFWQGNCDLSEGTDKVVRAAVERTLAASDASTGLAALNRNLWEARHVAGYIDDVALGAGEIRDLSALSEPERSRVLFGRAVRELARQPGRYLSLCMRRLRYFWLFDETNPKTRSWIYRTGHLGLTAMALLGLALAGAEVRRRLAPTVLVALLISLFHALTIVSARFHIPIEPLLALWAGAGLSRWGETRAASAPHGHHVVCIGVERRLGRECVG